jgi:alkylhydroperoxidase/carboxymuconolactone decarboxylase family protein YurZ
MSPQNPFELFKTEAPEVFEGFNGLIRSLMDMKALDPKTKQLIYIGMKAAQGDETAVFFHVPMAKQAGASRGEIIETILLTLTICGLKGINTCLAKALEIYDRE